LPEVSRFANQHGLKEIEVDAYGFTDPAIAVPRSRFWNCQSPTDMDEEKWAAVSANMILDAQNCEWLMQYPHETLGGGSMLVFHLPSRIPPLGSSGGPPAINRTREMFGMSVDVRVLLLKLTRDPQRLADLGLVPSQ
jgi:hypothetical protein